MVGSRLKEKWKSDLFARIEDGFVLNSAEKIILDNLDFQFRDGMLSYLCLRMLIFLQMVK